MTQEIMVLNPRKKKRTKKKGAIKAMPKAKKTTRRRRTYHTAAPAPKRTRRRARRNPSTGYRAKARKYGARAAHGARGLLASLAPMHTAKLALVNLAGALAAQFAANRLSGDVPGTSLTNWGKRSYLMAALGTFGASILADLIKKGSGKHVLQGGLALILYRVFCHEVAPQNSFLAQNFGEDSDAEMLAGFGASDGYQPGDIYTDGIGDDYLMGEDYTWQPLNESHRLLSGTDDILMGETVLAPGRLGEILAPPSHLGEDDPLEAFRQVYGGRN